MVSEGFGARIHRQSCVCGGLLSYKVLQTIRPERVLSAAYSTALFGLMWADICSLGCVVV